jgi:hypothetical protein
MKTKGCGVNWVWAGENQFMHYMDQMDSCPMGINGQPPRSEGRKTLIPIIQKWWILKWDYKYDIVLQLFYQICSGYLENLYLKPLQWQQTQNILHKFDILHQIIRLLWRRLILRVLYTLLTLEKHQNTFRRRPVMIENSLSLTPTNCRISQATPPSEIDELKKAWGWLPNTMMSMIFSVGPMLKLSLQHLTRGFAERDI